MESIETFFENASALETLFWVIAIGSSVVFIIQAILMFVGFDSDSDFSGGDSDFDADGMNLVSVKTVACFLIGFGVSEVSSRHLSCWVKQAEHCQRGTAQNTYILSWRISFALGFAASAIQSVALGLPDIILCLLSLLLAIPLKTSTT